jgi:hypothetical protein
MKMLASEGFPESILVEREAGRFLGNWIWLSLERGRPISQVMFFICWLIKFILRAMETKAFNTGQAGKLYLRVIYRHRVLIA